MNEIRFKITDFNDNSYVTHSEKYKLKYTNGTVVTSIEGSLGCMLFATIEDVRKFMKVCISRSYKIKKVRTLDEEYKNAKNTKISVFTSTGCLDLFYYNDKSYYSKTYPPYGTIFCNKIEVIEDIEIKKNNKLIKEYNHEKE